jgi:hypothetical protein
MAVRNVANLRDAMAVALEVREAELDAELGRSLDSVVKFLHGWRCAALRRDEREIDRLFEILGYDRAARVTAWLARRASAWDTFLFWERLEDRYARKAQSGAQFGSTPTTQI